MKRERYVIKNNLPEGIITPTGKFTRRNALQHFLGLVNFFETNNYFIKVILRNERNKPLRGTIQVEVDKFYYYVEIMPL